MQEFKFSCPHCGQHLQAPEDMKGQIIECPSCSNQLEIPHGLGENDGNPNTETSENNASPETVALDVDEKFSSVSIKTKAGWQKYIEELRLSLPTSTFIYEPRFSTSINGKAIFMMLLGTIVATPLGFLSYGFVILLQVLLASFVPSEYHLEVNQLTVYNWTLPIALPILHWGIRIIGYLLAFSTMGYTIGCTVSSFGRKGHSMNKIMHFISASISVVLVFTLYFILTQFTNTKVSVSLYIGCAIIGTIIAFFAACFTILDKFAHFKYCDACAQYMKYNERKITLGGVKALAYAFKNEDLELLQECSNSMPPGNDGTLKVWQCNSCGKGFAETVINLSGTIDNVEKTFVIEQRKIDFAELSPEEMKALKRSRYTFKM